MGGHISALEHLRKSTERANNAFNNLESRLGTLVEAVGQAVLILSHHAGPSRVSTVDATHTTHTTHTTHAAVHGAISPIH